MAHRSTFDREHLTIVGGGREAWVGGAGALAEIGTSRFDSAARMPWTLTMRTIIEVTHEDV